MVETPLHILQRGPTENLSGVLFGDKPRLFVWKRNDQKPSSGSQSWLKTRAWAAMIASYGIWQGDVFSSPHAAILRERTKQNNNKTNQLGSYSGVSFFSLFISFLGFSFLGFSHLSHADDSRGKTLSFGAPYVPRPRRTRAAVRRGPRIFAARWPMDLSELRAIAREVVVQDPVCAAGGGLPVCVCVCWLGLLFIIYIVIVNASRCPLRPVRFWLALRYVLCFSLP